MDCSYEIRVEGFAANLAQDDVASQGAVGLPVISTCCCSSQPGPTGGRVFICDIQYQISFGSSALREGSAVIRAVGAHGVLV